MPRKTEKDTLATIFSHSLFSQVDARTSITSEPFKRFFWGSVALNTPDSSLHSAQGATAWQESLVLAHWITEINS